LSFFHLTGFELLLLPYFQSPRDYRHGECTCETKPKPSLETFYQFVFIHILILYLVPSDTCTQPQNAAELPEMSAATIALQIAPKSELDVATRADATLCSDLSACVVAYTLVTSPVKSAPITPITSV
jgi:hypothetical protein